MKHLGDITKINGAEIEPVDCICFGSPCQDLSNAGKRAGLEGDRSGLFVEAIRIIKEMREHERDMGRTGINIRPRYAVWENVCGALSSNKGEDFRCVLEHFARVREPNVTIPKPPKKWGGCGAIEGDDFSIAWRVVDARYWGTAEQPTPQRRKRIAVVTDFAGQSASKILFECESLPRYLEQSREEKHPDAESIGRCIEKDNKRVAYSIDEKMARTYIHREEGNTLAARDYKQPQTIVIVEEP